MVSCCGSTLQDKKCCNRYHKSYIFEACFSFKPFKFYLAFNGIRNHQICVNMQKMLQVQLG